MNEPLPEVAALLPHQPPMRLLDRLTGWTEGRVEAQVDVVPAASFFRDGLGIPAWIGVEYLAQAAAVCFALRARPPGARGGPWNGGAAEPAAIPPRPGMLVACRRFDCAVSHFPEAATLTVTAWPVSALTGSLVKFAGEIHGDRKIAAGELSVYLS